MTTMGRLAFALVLLAGLQNGALGARDLYWRELAVTARLDTEGALHVREVHAMVFDGDWNGGERIFIIGAGQELTLHSVEKRSAGGRFEPLTRGDLGRVDQWDWYDSETLRWRSRAPQDPFFDNEELAYAIDYKLTGVLRVVGDSYLLDHDFAFARRDGVIERFVVDLELAPEWSTRHPVRRREVTNLQPGLGSVTLLDLDHADERKLDGVLYPIDRRWHQAALALALAGIAWMFGRFYRRESSLGSFDVTAAPAGFDWSWLQEHVLSWRAELAGALWDESIGPPEVAALIARWQSEGKVKGTVGETSSFFRRRVLELMRLVRMSGFDGYEYSLANKLFYDGRESVTTEKLRKHYKSKGFRPAAAIEKGLLTAISVRLGDDPPPPKPKAARTFLLFAAGGVALLPELIRFPEETLSWGLVTTATWAALFLVGLLGALRWRKRVSGLRLRLLYILVPLLALVAAYGWFLSWFSFGPRVLGVFAVVCFVLGTASCLFHQAATRAARSRVEHRRRLAIGRRMLARELKSPDPRIHDDTFPHLIALGLQRHMDRWWRAFGTQRTLDTTRSWSGSGGGGGGGWTGGGGAFGGAGATAAWTAAATGMAAGVAAPSSSGGGGGGSSGGSSGGGGGGGW